jgi:hypothetical protein
MLSIYRSSVASFTLCFREAQQIGVSPHEDC